MFTVALSLFDCPSVYLVGLVGEEWNRYFHVNSRFLGGAKWRMLYFGFVDLEKALIGFREKW